MDEYLYTKYLYTKYIYITYVLLGIYYVYEV